MVINCGQPFDSNDELEQHIIDNPSHVVVEQYYDTESIPSSLALNNGSENVKININEEGSLQVETENEVFIKNNNAYVNINYVNKKNKAPTKYLSILTLNFKNIKNINYIELISEINKSWYSEYIYDVRFYCVDLKKVLKEVKGLKNTKKEAIMVSDPENIEENECIIELQVRTNNKRALLHIYEMNVVYN